MEITRITNARKSVREWLQKNEQYFVCFVTATTPWKTSYEVFVLNYEQQQLTSEIKLKVFVLQKFPTVSHTSVLRLKRLSKSSKKRKTNICAK